MGCPFPAESSLFFFYSWIIYSLTEITRDINPPASLENNKVYHRILNLGRLKLMWDVWKLDGYKHGGQSCLVNQLHYIHSDKESSSRTFEQRLNWGKKNAEKTKTVFSTWLLCLRTSCPWKKKETWQPSLNCVLTDHKIRESETLGTMLNYDNMCKQGVIVCTCNHNTVE